MKQTLRNILKALILIVAALVVVAAVYAVYLLVTYSRIDDVTQLEVSNNSDLTVRTGKTYKAVTYNVGFGSYSPEYSFFMDTSTWKNGKVTTGIYGKGISLSDVIKNTEGSAAVLRDIDADFVLLQEVDTPSTRSFGVDMKSYYEASFPEMASTFAVNFHSSWLNLPLLDPHGVANAGLLTLSYYDISSAERISYPVSDSLSKIADLDRCFSVQRITVDNGRELVIINSHMSAYDEGGVIRKAQLEMLMTYLETEYRKGNYVIVGGDFNHALGEEYVEAFATEMAKPDWVSILSDDELPEGFSIVKPSTGFRYATCRSADIPYTKGINYETIVDGFIVSDNIKAESIVYNTDYAYSDHQPVVLTFTLE
jgi:endonuclease/exonuclease/phosphatase family metal-dependent hydrolase